MKGESINGASVTTLDSIRFDSDVGRAGNASHLTPSGQHAGWRSLLGRVDGEHDSDAFGNVLDETVG
jgi:hypothetical protein